jgi:uncharacterized protein DUF5701
MPTTQAINAAQYRGLQYRERQGVETLPSPQELFEQIVEVLVAKGLMSYPAADPFRKDLPAGLFLLVPSRPAELDLDHLASMIKIDGEYGKNYLDPGCLTDAMAVPAGSYLMSGIQDGRKYLNVKPSIAKAKVVAERRSTFAVYEGVIYGMVFGQRVFAHHNIYLCGSRYRSEGREGFPQICLNVGTPSLGVNWNDRADPDWGMPSCAGRRCRWRLMRIGVALTRKVVHRLPGFG